MTIEELAELSADKLKALTSAEKMEILSPYFNVTRPELVERPKKVEELPEMHISEEKRRILEELKESGIDMSFLNLRKRKKT